MEAYFWSNTNPIVIQNLVKRYDGRFISNPFSIGYNPYRYNYNISFDDIDNANKFDLMKYITEQSFY